MIEPFDKDIYYKNGEYIIKEIVCDYEIIDSRNNEEPKMILNCFYNAKLICDILKSDDLHEYFKFEQKPIEITQMEHLQKELALYKKALYWACQYITKIVDKDINKLAHEWAEHFLNQAREQNAFEDRREIYKLAEGWEDEE